MKAPLMAGELLGSLKRQAFLAGEGRPRADYRSVPGGQTVWKVAEDHWESAAAVNRRQTTAPLRHLLPPSYHYLAIFSHHRTISAPARHHPPPVPQPEPPVPVCLYRELPTGLWADVTAH